MILVTRHNEYPFEMTAELVQFLESLPAGVTFVTTTGEVLVHEAGDKQGSTGTDNYGGARRNCRSAAR